MFCMQYAFPTKCVLYAICFPELHYIIFFYLGICRTSSSMAHVGILSRNDAMLKRLQLWVANMITAWAHHLPNDFFFGLRNSTYSPEHEFWISSCTLKLQHISGNAYFMYQLEMPTGSLTILYWRCLGWDCCYPLLIQEFGMWCYVLWKCETLICNPGLFWQKQMINVWNIGMLLAFFSIGYSAAMSQTISNDPAWLKCSYQLYASMLLQKQDCMPSKVYLDPELWMANRV